MWTAWTELYDARRKCDPWLARGRLGGLGSGFAIALLMVWLNAATWEHRHGDDLRSRAAQIVERLETVRAPRGRILSAEGTPLVSDEESWALTLDYPWLAEPPEETWLHREARRRLTEGSRHRAHLLAERKAILREREALHRRLAQLAGLDIEAWNAKLVPIRERVERIARHVNKKRREWHRREQQVEAGSRWERFGRIFLSELFSPPEPLPPAPIVVAEQRQPHVVIARIPASLARHVEAHPAFFPGVKVERRTSREYHFGHTAAHLLGFVGRGEAVGEFVGKAGLERQMETRLAGAVGKKLFADDGEQTLCAAESGEDIHLTLRLELQQVAEQLLDAALHRRDLLAEKDTPGGGAVVVLNVQTGAILALASAPRFSPAEFSEGDMNAIARAQHDPRNPLFHRGVQMALAPGSVFKLVTAAALLEEQCVPPELSFSCRGYLHSPDELRCAHYRRTGEGHGPTDLDAALVKSCNVFFFHHMESLTGDRLPRWAYRLGFGRPSDSGVPGEVAGTIPSLDTSVDIATLRQVAIGQGPVTATPLQVAALAAMIANGGHRVRPYLLAEEVPREPGVLLISPETARILRQSLRGVVEKESGTARVAAAARGLFAGKTGTAEVAGELPPHAWFAGFAPADEPEIAMAVVVEHGGDGGRVAAPIARIMAERWLQLSPRVRKTSLNRDTAASEFQGVRAVGFASVGE